IFPISENELQSLTFDREILEEVAINCFDENSENNPIQKSFRLPESSVQKQKANLAEKIKLKTTEIKSSKNCNEEPKQIEDDDVSFLMQQSNNLAKQAEKFNK
ncbi:MAG: hypothetical protein IJV56_03330, partial [Neisseriaceae bacterium]|nr:hypothetical protein [Neisseriaceae bacterium]